MVVVNDAQANGEYFAGRNDEGREVLFELFDHSIDEHLANGTEHSHDEHVEQEESVLEDKVEDFHNLQENAGVHEGNDRHPFVYLSHHFHRLWFVLRFDLSLEIGKKSVGQKRHNEKDDADELSLFLIFCRRLRIKDFEHNNSDSDYEPNNDLLGGKLKLLIFNP